MPPLPKKKLQKKKQKLQKTGAFGNLGKRQTGPPSDFLLQKKVFKNIFPQLLFVMFPNKRPQDTQQHGVGICDPPGNTAQGTKNPTREGVATWQYQVGGVSTCWITLGDTRWMDGCWRISHHQGR